MPGWLLACWHPPSFLSALEWELNISGRWERRQGKISGLSRAIQSYLTCTKCFKQETAAFLQSWNHRKVWAERDLKDPVAPQPDPTICAWRCHSEAPMVQTGMGSLFCSSVLQNHPGFPGDTVCCSLETSSGLCQVFPVPHDLSSLSGLPPSAPTPPLDSGCRRAK